MLVLLTLSTYTLIRRLDINAVAVARDAQTARALGQARQRLIDYAVTFYDLAPQNAGRFGVLPCPDTASGGIIPEGAQHGPCGATHAVSMGRLPWRTLGMKAVRDGYGECLWYVVSGDYKQTQPAANRSMLNEDTNGLLAVFAADGETPLAGGAPGGRAVAAVIAPGPALGGQSRTRLTGTDICDGQITPAAYLDPELPENPPGGIRNDVISLAPDTIESFVHSDARTNRFNDRIAFVTREDVFAAIRRRAAFAERLYLDATPAQPPSLTGAVAGCIAGFHAINGGRLVWAAPLLLADYRRDALYDDAELLSAGRVPNLLDDSAIPVTLEDCLASEPDGEELVELWENWKDHLFYAVADPFRPSESPGPICGGSCLSVNGGAARYAAVVLFSRERLSGQSRDPVDKWQTANYLEAANANGIRLGPTAGFTDFTSSTATADFNDVVYCVTPDYSAARCCVDAGC